MRIPQSRKKLSENTKTYPQDVHNKNILLSMKLLAKKIWFVFKL